MRRIVAGLGLFWAFAWLLAVVLLWAAESRLVFMADNSRTFTAPFDSAIFDEGTLRNADGLSLQSVLLTHGSNFERYWILFCPPAGASIRVRLVQDQLHQLWTLGYWRDDVRLLEPKRVRDANWRATTEPDEPDPQTTKS